jgi:pyruvate/2-oxoglutarate dehydrogenase complex dihydrolipoamide acyltransferase (E2) component
MSNLSPTPALTGACGRQKCWRWARAGVYAHAGMRFMWVLLREQVAILAVGAAMQRVVPVQGGGFETASYINATLSCDHRVRRSTWLLPCSCWQQHCICRQCA